MKHHQHHHRLPPAVHSSIRRLKPLLVLPLSLLLFATTYATVFAFHNPVIILSRRQQHPQQFLHGHDVGILPTTKTTIARTTTHIIQSTTTIICSQTTNDNDLVDISEYAARDTNYLQEWAYNCGVQTSDGLQLTSDDGGYDIYAMTNTDVPSGSCILYVPSNMYLTSYNARQEFGQLEESEKLIGSLAGSDQFPLFYLFLKVLVEYERGINSDWYPWLNSLPRIFNSGAAMTPSCYDCLPPLAAKFCMEERVKFINCKQALKFVDFVSDTTKKDEELLKWVFNVVETRCLEAGDGGGERIIIPMADMFNHGSSGHEVEISYDDEGSCVVYTTTDVPAGSPLRRSYGDYYLTNPSATFARYGFIDETCPSTFCKIMDIIPSTELRNIGLSFSRMLFYKDTGEVSEEVYDVLLYQILSEHSNRHDQEEFYNACITGNAELKNAYHQQYLGETISKLKAHVDKFILEMDELYKKASMKDLSQNTRLPLIVMHNEFVRETFMRVKEQIDPLYEELTSYR